MRRMQRSFEFRIMDLWGDGEVSSEWASKRSSAYEPVLLNASCLTGAGTPIYSVQSHWVDAASRVSVRHARDGEEQLTSFVYTSQMWMFPREVPT